MKIIIQNNIEVKYKRRTGETLDDFMAYYMDLQHILDAFRTDYAVWTKLSHTTEEFSVILITQNIWLEETKAAAVFANVFELFVDLQGKKLYTTEIEAFAEDRLTVVVRPL